MIEPTGEPSAWIKFYDTPGGDVAVVLKTGNKIYTPEERTPAQATAYDVLKVFTEKSQADGDKVKTFHKHGDMTEYVVGKVK